MQRRPPWNSHCLGGHLGVASVRAACWVPAVASCPAWEARHCIGKDLLCMCMGDAGQRPPTFPASFLGFCECVPACARECECVCMCASVRASPAVSACASLSCSACLPGSKRSHLCTRPRHASCVSVSRVAFAFAMVAVSAPLRTSKRPLVDEALAEVTERLKRLRLDAPSPERVDWTWGRDARVWRGTWLQVTIGDSEVPVAVEQLSLERLQ